MKKILMKMTGKSNFVICGLILYLLTSSSSNQAGQTDDSFEDGSKRPDKVEQKE